MQVKSLEISGTVQPDRVRRRTKGQFSPIIVTDVDNKASLWGMTEDQMEEMRRGILPCAKTKTLFSGRRERKMWTASRRHEEGPYSAYV